MKYKGMKVVYPLRTCEECKLYPCIINLDKLETNFAKIGCKKFKPNT